jgi:hypothetical protein
MAGRAGFTGVKTFFSMEKMDSQKDREEAEQNAECKNARFSMDHRLARILKQNPGENQVNPAIGVEWGTDFAYNPA